MQTHVSALTCASTASALEALREQVLALQDEIVGLRILMATKDAQRQQRREAVDAQWLLSTKTLLQAKRLELGRLQAKLVGMESRARKSTEWLRILPREAFRDALLEVVRQECDDEVWAMLKSKARALQAREEAAHGANS